MFDNIRKWNLKFDGTTDPVSFLERVDELAGCYGYAPDSLLVVLPELLKGKVLLWYRNNKNNWQTWGDFIRIPGHVPATPSPLPARGGDKEEDPGVSGESDGVCDRHSDPHEETRGVRPADRLERIYENLDTPTQSFVPEIACAGRASKPARRQNQVSPTRDRHPLSQVTYAETRVASIPTPPVAAAPGPRRNETASRRLNVCWRCGIAGHYRTNCSRPPRLFCSFCGKTGTLTRNCPCHQQGNGQRRLERVESS